MRSPVRESLKALGLATLVATALPAAADETKPISDSPTSCRVPQAGDAAPAAPQADLGTLWSRIAADIPKAQAAGVRPLNTRGYNYDMGHGGLDPAALVFESRGR